MIEPLHAEELAKAVSLDGLRLRCEGCVESTNLVVKDAIRAGEAPGLVVSALKQEGGYGRQGRSWVSPVGGLYTSFFVEPCADLEQLASMSPAAGLAVVRAIDEVLMGSGLDCQTVPAAPKIKWPNDVVCAGGKLCGISVELVGRGLCIGIGINLFQPAGAMEVGGKNVPSYLADLLLRDDRVAGTDLSPSQRQLASAMLESLLFHFWDVHRRWAEGGFPAIRQEYENRATLVGQAVSMRNISDDQITEGVVEGFDDQARLLLRLPSGELHPIPYGEVHIL